MRFVRAHLKSVVALGLASGAALGGVIALQACSLRNCDLNTVWLGNAPPGAAPEGTTYGAKLPTQHALDETTWESGPITGPYLDFPGQRSYIFNPFLDLDPSGAPFVGPYTNITAYISADPDPTTSNFTIASGNAAEIFGITNGGFTVHNDTCAQYYLRVVVERGAPNAWAVDAGADAADAGSESGAPDATTDAADQ